MNDISLLRCFAQMGTPRDALKFFRSMLPDVRNAHTAATLFGTSFTGIAISDDERCPAAACLPF
jgi:hypothetical protein